MIATVNHTDARQESRPMSQSNCDLVLGCLQDIHWSAGAWGCFPTYTLGAMMAAQLFQAARRTEPDILPALSVGDFGPLRSWLRAHVHANASLLTTEELLVAATGRPFETGVFRAHLRERYGDQR